MGIIRNALVKVTRKVIEKSPTICATIAVGCALGSAYGFVKATLKSREALDEREDQLAALDMQFDEDPSIDEETQKQMRRQVNINCFKRIWKHFITPVVTLGVEIASIIGCHKGHGKKEALLAGLLNFASDDGTKVINKAEEIIGKKKMQSIRDEANIDEIKKTASNSPKIIETGHGSEIFIHKPTGQVFRASTAHVLNCITKVQNDFHSEDFVSMNSLLLDWGANSCDIGGGDMLGFPAEKFIHHTLLDQTRIVSWDNPDTGEVWKMITHPLELRADDHYVSIPCY